MAETKQMKFAEYEERILGLPSIALRFIMRDAKKAIEALPDGPNAGYYADEIMVCGQELTRRLKPKKTNRESEYHSTLTEIVVILDNAGYCSNNLLDDLRDLVNDSSRPATEEAEGVDFHAKYEELIESILSWASTAQNHGGNPYGHSFMKLVPWKERK